MPRGTADVLQEIITDLQNYQPLTRGLQSPEAIFAAHPAAETNYSLAVIVTVISDTSTPRRSVYERNWRIQITAKASRPWLERHSQDAQVVLHRVLDAVGERLDRAHGIEEIPLGSETGGPPNPMNDNMLAISNDWRVRGFEYDGSY